MAYRAARHDHAENLITRRERRPQRRDRRQGPRHGLLAQSISTRGDRPAAALQRHAPLFPSAGLDAWIYRDRGVGPPSSAQAWDFQIWRRKSTVQRTL